MLFAIVTVVVLSFGLVVFVGPPYLPTLSPQVKAALDMLELEKGQTMLELGCGDGRVLLAAAERGWKVVGIELNPILVLVCKVRTWRYRRLVTVRWGNYWDVKLWGDADGIFGFVLPRYMPKLDRLIEEWRGDRRVRLSSFAFTIPDKHVIRQASGVFLYEYK